jgi:hypothetical protein
VFALSQFGGKTLYLRTTSFVDCSALSVPHYERVLCPPQPLGHRLDPSYYAWQDPHTIPRLNPPPGVTDDQAMHQFAVAAIRQQFASYAKIVLRDFALNFDVVRTNRFEYSSSDKWLFSHYPPPHPRDKIRQAYAQHGGRQLSVTQPYANALGAYQRVGYLPGPLLLGCLLLGLLGGLGVVGQARASRMRSITLLLSVTGTGLLLVPDIAGDFSWRYQMPALALLPAGAALGITALRGGRRTGKDAEASSRPPRDSEQPDRGVTESR